MSCRQRKDELEQRMSSLQESRRELMVQLEGLMKLLKVMNATGPLFFGCLGGDLSLPLPPVSVPSTGSALVSPLTVPDFSLSILFLPLCFCPCCGPVGRGAAAGSKSPSAMLDFQCEFQQFRCEKWPF